MDINHSIQRMEKILIEMESENLDIDTLMKLYGEGMEIVNTCKTQLDTAKVTISNSRGETI